MKDLTTQDVVPQDPVLDAAASVFVRYGMRRATMGDIAKAADVSRQTLYGRYVNKTGIAAATMVYFTRRGLAEVEDAWRSQATLGEKLDSYFETIIVSYYRLIAQNPDARELEHGEDGSLATAGRQCADLKAATLTRLFAAHGAPDPGALGRMVAHAASGFKTSATSEEDLKALLGTLKSLVLAMLAPEEA